MWKMISVSTDPVKVKRCLQTAIAEAGAIPWPDAGNDKSSFELKM